MIVSCRRIEGVSRSEFETELCVAVADRKRLRRRKKKTAEGGVRRERGEETRS